MAHTVDVFGSPKERLNAVRKTMEKRTGFFPGGAFAAWMMDYFDALTAGYRTQ